MARVRDDLQQLSGYHSPQVDARVRLNTNEAPEAPSAQMMQRLCDRVSTLPLHRYPDREATELRGRLADRHGVQVGQIHVANGSNEVLQHVLLAFGGPGRTAVVFGPSYQMHSQIASITGTTVIDLGRGSDGLINEADLGDEVPRDVVFVTSPNNPTGRVEKRSTIVDHVLPWCVEGNALLVIDEAYVEFSMDEYVDLIGTGHPVLISRTFSKTLALAGVRLGYALAGADIIEGLELVTLPYHLSALTQAAGLAALEDTSELDDRVAMLVRGRDQIVHAFSQLGVEYENSHANFILFAAPDGRGDELWQQLVRRGVLVRNCSSWPGLAGRLRVTVGTPEDNAMFISALSAALKEMT